MITDQALDRLEASLLFYIRELEMPVRKAKQLQAQLFKRARGLSRYPYRGQYEPYLRKLGKGYRRLIEESFKIIYRIEGETVYITDFFDTRQSPEKMKG